MHIDGIEITKVDKKKVAKKTNNIAGTSMHSDQELRRRLSILQDQFKEGKIHLSEEVYDGMADSLSKVMVMPNGEVDLNTVDSRVRSLAMGVTAMHDREENKKAIPLHQIQRAYFNIIEVNFSNFYEMMKKANKDPHVMGTFFSEKPEVRSELVKVLPDFLAVLAELWDSCGDVVWDHARDLDGIKLMHGGDLFPSYTHNIASKCGIYGDTIAIPDPFARSFELYNLWNDEQKVYYFIKHALSVLEYKDLALAELNTPIVIVLPEPSLFDDFEPKYLSKMAEADAVKFASGTFNRDFESIEAASEFFSQLDTKDKVLQEVMLEDRLLFDLDIGNCPEKQLDKLLKPQFSGFENLNPGEIILGNFVGRMGQANHALLKSRRMNSVPLIDAPTSWRYFNWKLDLDNESVNNDLSEQLHCTHALTALDGTELEWLGNIPPASLIEMREQGAIAEIRDIMTKNVSNLIESNPMNFGETSYQVYTNFQAALADHKKEIDRLKRQKWKFAGVDVGGMIVLGAVNIALYAKLNVPLYAATLVAGHFLDTPNPLKIPKIWRGFNDKQENLKNSPIGMLITCKDAIK
ncbi:hypothetical protein M2H13_16560 [Vibrio vulnificus]|nr:hypothetical protein [Vibrio vulnificus]